MNVVKGLFSASSSISSQWALAAGLNPNRSCVDVPLIESGVNLTTLMNLASSITKLGHGASSYDTYAVVKNLIKPVTAAKKCRLFDLIDPAVNQTGMPHYFISYPWAMPFTVMVKQVEHELKRASMDDATPVHPDRIFLWLDIIATTQHTVFNAQADISLVKSLIKSCSGGLALVVDASLTTLNRSWCMFEAWSFVYLDGISKLRVCMPLDLDVSLLARYEEHVYAIDLNKTDSTKPEDKTRILSEIRGSSGLKMMQRSLQEALVVGVRSALRWGSSEDDSMKSLGLYAGLLLKGSEYHRLQRLLHETPSIRDDGEMLKEVQEVFLLYVDGPEDELDEEQFCKVLLRSGFTSDEAHRIYHEVNTDDGPGVGLEEFREWWMKSKRQEDTRRRPPLSLSAHSLLANLENLTTTLERVELHDLADSIKECMSSEHFKNSVKPNKDLPAAVLKGDSRAVADKAAWTLHNRDYRKTVLILMDVIRWNLDAIDVPPHQLPRPDKEENLTAESLFSALRVYLEQFSLLLCWEGKGKQEQHAEYFMRFSQELKNESTVRLLIEAHEALGLSAAKLDFEKVSVVREMISLKYGPRQPLNHSLIIEAEKSLSMWMAGNRRDAKQSQGMVRDLANDYLSSYNPNKASEVAVVSIPGRGVIKGLDKKKRLSVCVPDDEIPSVLTKLGPEAAAYEAARRAAEASSKAKDDPEGGDGKVGSNAHGDAEKTRKAKSRRSSTTSLMDLHDVASMELISQGGAFSGIQTRLQRLTPSPSPNPLEPYVPQQQSDEDYFGTTTGVVNGRSSSAMSFSSPSAVNSSQRTPSFLSPPSRSQSSMSFVAPTGKARRASTMLPSEGLALGSIQEGGKGGCGEEGLVSMPGLAASLLASAGFGSGPSSSASLSPPTSTTKSVSRFNRRQSIDTPADLYKAGGTPSASSPLSPTRLRDKGNSKEYALEGERSSYDQKAQSANVLPRLPNYLYSKAEDKGQAPNVTSPSRMGQREPSGSAQLPNILARRSVI